MTLVDQLSGKKSPDEHSYNITEHLDDNSNVIITLVETLYDGKRSGKNLKVILRNSLSELEQRRKEIKNSIEKISRFGEKDDVDTCRVSQILTKLREDGEALRNFIFGSVTSQDNLELLNRFLNRPVGLEGRLNILADNFLIDYEFLAENNPNTSDRDCFIARKYIISKRFSGDSSSIIFTNANRPKFTFLAHRSFNGSNETELESIRDLHDLNKIELQDFHDRSIPIKSIVETRHYDLLHFACHLYLNHEELGSYLDLGDQILRLRDLEGISNSQEKYGKVVFLNACNGGHPGILSSYNFTSIFTKGLGFASVITPSYTVPYRFAGKFGGTFLKKVFETDGILDKALFETAKDFSRNDQWGGLFYSVYGEISIN